MSSSVTLGGGHAGSLGDRLGYAGWLPPSGHCHGPREVAGSGGVCGQPQRQAGSAASTEPRPFLTRSELKTGGGNTTKVPGAPAQGSACPPHLAHAQPCEGRIRV